MHSNLKQKFFMATKKKAEEVSLEEVNEIKAQMREIMDKVTPKYLYDYLNQYVIGQEEAKKYISVAVYNHICYP